jgi:aminoglycoside phosphotransferase (APT) family kinase protein
VTINGDLSSRLLHILQTATATPTLDYKRPPAPLNGGFWAELLAFSLADPPPGWPHELVARLMPDASVARKETIVQTAVAATGFPTPVVRMSGGPDNGLGRAFMIMDRVSGAPLLAGLNGIGALASAIGLLRQMPQVLAATTANLHALDPQPVRDQLDPIDRLPVTVPALLDELYAAAVEYRRPDLASAGRWLIDHPPAPAPEVICHGDLHPLNLLVNGDQLTVVDWSAALLAPRAHDLAFTALLLAEPPLIVPGILRPLVRRVGAGLAHRFVDRYQRHAEVTIDAYALRWHQGVVCLRALVEVAGWAHAGLVDTRTGHPFLVSGPAIAQRLGTLTSTPVEAL